ncbi:MAG: ABC transporter ATP-binding protein [Anaerolineales bacterium]|nr:ABC transporter ATP-binding protein [Anaerolineales bacterium]
MSEYAILTDNLSMDFKNVKAVDQLNLEVPIGNIFGFLGPNGSGKTTTIRLLLGLLHPTMGSARVLGYNTLTQSDEIRFYSGALLEHTGLYERQSAMDNLDFYGRVWHMGKEAREKRIRELLEEVGLWDRKDEVVNNWSRGMKQKLGIARAMLHKPRLLFLDEPTAGLDPVAASTLRDDLSKLSATQKVTIFLTTHNLNEAEKLCDQVGVIKSGKLLATGSPTDLKNRMGDNHLEIVCKGFNPTTTSILETLSEINSVTAHKEHISLSLNETYSTNRILRLLMDNDVQIEEVRKGNASLEEIFLDLVEENHVVN